MKTRATSRLLMACALLFCDQAVQARPGAFLVAQQDEDAVSKELERSRESAREAVNQAREAQEKLSISENIKKAEEKRAADQASWFQSNGTKLLAAVMGLAIGIAYGRAKRPRKRK